MALIFFLGQIFVKKCWNTNRDLCAHCVKFSSRSRWFWGGVARKNFVEKVNMKKERKKKQ